MSDKKCEAHGGLKCLVKMMGLVLIVGSAFVAGSIAYKANNSSSGGFYKKHGKHADCTYANGSVSVNGEVVSAQKKRNVVTLLTKQRKGQQELILLDVCSGVVMSTYTLNDARVAAE